MTGRTLFAIRSNNRYFAERLRGLDEAGEAMSEYSIVVRKQQSHLGLSEKEAICVSKELSQSEMRALFASLRDTQFPAHDVHGRSTIVQLSWDELERKFGRK